MIRRLVPSFLLLALMAAVTAPPALAADPLRLCTGSPGKTYIRVGQKLAELARTMTMGQLVIEPVPSQGSIDNLNRTLAGECDGFIAQGDALAFFQAKVDPKVLEKVQVVGTLYKELGMLLCHRRTGIGDLDEVGDGTVAAGSFGSGSFATLVVLQQAFPDLYGRIRIYPANGFEGALAILDGKADCLFEVIAPQSDLLRVLNENDRTGSQLYFAEIDNSDLEEIEIAGKQVYDIVTFNDELYRNLATFGDPETLAISAVLGVSRAYYEAHPEARSALAMLILSAQRDIEAVAYGETKPFRD